MKRVDILFNAKLNVDKLEEQLSGIKKQTVEVGVDSSSMKEFKEVENTVKDIKKQYEDLSKKKLDMKTFEKSMAKVDQQFKDLNNKLGSLADQFANIAKNMPSEKVINLVNSFADATAEAKELANQATIIKDTINSTAKKAYKNTLINGDDSEELERIVGKLRELQAIIGGRKKIDLGVKNNGDDVKYIKDIVTNIETLEKEFKNLTNKRDEFESSGKDTISDEFVDLQEKAVIAARKIVDLTTELKNFKKSIDLSDVKISNGMDLSEIRDDMIEELKDMEAISKTYARSIDENLRLIDAKPKGKNKKKENVSKDQDRSGKPIGVPLYISTGAGALQKQIDRVVDVVQANTSKTPIQVTISLISDFKSNKYKKELEKLHKDVDKIGDDGLRESFEKLTSQITSDLTYNIKTDILNAEIELRKAITRIKRELNKNRLPVSPKIEITEKKQKSIQRQLDNLAKTITLNINKIDISEKAIQEAMGNKKGKNKLIDAKSIADTAALANIIDKIIESNKEFMGTNKGVYKSLKEIKDLMNAMPTNEIVEPIKELVSIAQNLTSIIPKTDLDTVFDGMKKDVEEITGSLRNKENLKAIKAILQEYEKYVSMGGTKSITELGGAKNVQNWFKNHYNTTDGQEFGNQYAKGIEESKPQVKNAAEEMVKTAIDATADTQDSHSPARVAYQLGQYWGKGYANGILKTEGEVKDAIRALYEKGKLSFKDIENDRDIHAMISSSVADDIMYDEEASEQVKKFMNIIDILDEYSKKSREANLNSVKGFPEDVRRTLTNVANKNLEDIRNGSIDASQAVERLAKAFEEVNENMAKMDADSASDKIVENVEKEVKAEEKKREVKKEIKKTSEETVEVQKQEQKVVEKVGQTYQKVKDDVEEISDEMQEAFTKMEHDTIDNIAKSNDDHTMKVLSKYKALPDSAFKGLDNLSMGKDEGNAKLANELLDLYGEYNNNPNKETLSKIYTKTYRSNLSDKMKHSITNHLMKIVEEVNRGATEAVDEAPKTFDKPKTKLISMSKGEYKEFVKNNHLIPMGNSASDFENNFKQHLKGLEEKGLTRSKYDKNGRLRRMQIAVEVLDQDAIDKTEKKVDNVEKKTEEVKTATKEVKEEVANVNKELDNTADKSSEVTKSLEESAKSIKDIDPEKDLADYNKDISNYVNELMEELNIDDKPIVSKENTEESVSNINKIEDSFKELQEWSSKWIIAGGKNKNYKDGAKKLAAQYAKYKEQGGTQDVEALDKRVTVVRAVRAELEKMQQAEQESANATVKSENKVQEELKETKEIIEDANKVVNDSNNSFSTEKTKKEIADTKKEVTKFLDMTPSINNTVMDGIEDVFDELTDKVSSGELTAEQALERLEKKMFEVIESINKFEQLDPNSTFTHIGSSSLDRDKFEKVSNNVKGYQKGQFNDPTNRNKPYNGFWAVPTGEEFSWESIAEDMNKGAEYLAQHFTFKFKEDAKVLILKSFEDIQNLPRIKEYTGLNKDLDSMVQVTNGKGRNGEILPDWETIGKYYDGIMVINDALSALSSWDIDSVVVTNPDAIEQIKEETQSVIEDAEAQKKLSEVKKETIKEDNNKSNTSSSNNNIIESQDKIQSELQETNFELDKQEKKWKEYSDGVAVGADRIRKMRIISESGTVGDNSVYDLLRLNHPIWDEVKANHFFNDIPEEGLQRYKKILEVVERICKEMLNASGLTEEQFVSQLKEINSAEGGSFRINGQDAGWTHFATYTDDKKDKMPSKNDLTYKVYASFDDIKDLNKNVISSLMEELTKAGFKGRLKTTSGSTSFGDKINGLGITDQLVVHGASKKDQEIAYNTIKKLLGKKLSYLGGGIDTKDGSFSQTLASGNIEKYIKQVKEATNAEKEFIQTQKQSNETPISSETKKETSKKKSSKKNENKETALTVNDTKTASIATESAEAIKKEAEALEHVETTAKNASKAKDNFAKSNKKVDESAKSSSKSIKEESDSLNDVNKAADKKPKSTYNKEIGYLKQRNKLEQEIARTPNDNINNTPKTERIVQLDEKINALRAERKKLNAEDIEQQTKIDDLLEEHQFKLNQINQQLVQREVNDKKNAIDKNIGSIDKMLVSTRYTDSYKEKLSELKNSLLEFKDVLVSTDGSDVDKISEDFERLQTEITQTVDVAKQLDINKVINVDAIDKLGVKIANFGDQNTAMGKKFKSQLDEIQKKWEEFKISDNADVNRASLKALNDQFLELERSVSLAGKTGDSFVVGIGKRIKSVTQSAIAMSFSFYDVIRYARELGEVVLQTDTALTELRKVSDAPTARLQQSFEESANTARELGATITDVIDATSAWARMGYNLDASEELARVTTLYKNVGDGITQEEASQSLISTLQGYQMAYTEAEDIIDEFNEVSNNFAITSGGIGESLQRSAAAFNAANTDLSKSIALIAGTK